MKKQLSTFSIITVFTFFAIIGLCLIPLLNVQLTSDHASLSLTTNYTWPNTSAKIIEQEVTSKLEGLFNSIQGVSNITSTSKKGIGRVSVYFKKNVNMDAVRLEVAYIIRRIYPNLPSGVSYPQLSIGTVSESNSPILSYSINSNQSPLNIKNFADNEILPKLSSIGGVGHIGFYGVPPYEWTITYNTDKMIPLGLSADDISLALKDYFKKKSLGLAQFKTLHSNNNLEISVELKHSDMNLNTLGKFPVKKLGNRIIHLKDVAKIRFQEGPIKAYYRVNGLNTINMVIYPEKGINHIEFANSLKKEVNKLKFEFRNTYDIKLIQDSSEFLVNELRKIQFRTLFSLLILMVLVAVVYRNLKYLYVLFLSIVVNFLIAVILYYLLNVQLQLYSFAGITISFGIIIDNSIIMIDHLRNKGDKKVFLAIFAATLTSIGAIIVIFFLQESQRLNLWDFASVIAINLGTSLLVSYYFIPALGDRLKIQAKRPKISWNRKRRNVLFTRRYISIILMLKRPLFKRILIITAVLVFGIPLHLIPSKLSGEGFWTVRYNEVLNNEWFSSEIHGSLEKILGGTLRLFTDEVFENSYYSEPERTTLRVMGAMPEGCTIEQLNNAIQKMEQFISSFANVELFETQVTSYRNSSINIYFKEEHEFGVFPYTLKSLLENKALSLGGLDWSITGVGQGFSNALGSGRQNDRILLEGFNYDELQKYAQQLRKQLLENSNGRITEMEINSGVWNDNTLYEYHLDFNKENLAVANISSLQLHQTLKTHLHRGQLMSFSENNAIHDLILVSNRFKSFNIWDLKNTPIDLNNRHYKLKELATITKKKAGNTIRKRNQQYRLELSYDFIGHALLAQKFKEQSIDKFSELLPIGYRAFEQTYFDRWDKNENKQYYYLAVVIIIIFFICVILLESLKQPLPIIGIIPISFIGLFLTFFTFDLNFDQGGYAAFILLCGISVNSALYIVNDYNILKSRYPRKDSYKLYFKAFNYKILPIILTITSTIAGLLPFLWGGQNEVFWFAFAAGAIGGLIFSLIGIFVYLPLFIVK